MHELSHQRAAVYQPKQSENISHCRFFNLILGLWSRVSASRCQTTSISWILQTDSCVTSDASTNTFTCLTDVCSQLSVRSLFLFSFSVTHKSGLRLRTVSLSLSLESTRERKGHMHMDDFNVSFQQISHRSGPHYMSLTL